MGRSLAELQQEMRQILSRTEREKEEAVQRQDKLTHEMAELREKMRKAQDDYKAVCDEAAEARVKTVALCNSLISVQVCSTLIPVGFKRGLDHRRNEPVFFSFLAIWDCRTGIFLW